MESVQAGYLEKDHEVAHLIEEGQTEMAIDLLYKKRLCPSLSLWHRAEINCLLSEIGDVKQDDCRQLALEALTICRDIRRRREAAAMANYEPKPDHSHVEKLEERVLLSLDNLELKEENLALQAKPEFETQLGPKNPSKIDGVGSLTATDEEPSAGLAVGSPPNTNKALSVAAMSHSSSTVNSVASGSSPNTDMGDHGTGVIAEWGSHEAFQTEFVRQFVDPDGNIRADVYEAMLDIMATSQSLDDREAAVERAEIIFGEREDEISRRLFEVEEAENRVHKREEEISHTLSDIRLLLAREETLAAARGGEPNKPHRNSSLSVADIIRRLLPSLPITDVISLNKNLADNLIVRRIVSAGPRHSSLANLNHPAVSKSGDGLAGLHSKESKGAPVSSAWACPHPGRDADLFDGSAFKMAFETGSASPQGLGIVTLQDHPCFRVESTVASPER